MQNKETKLLDDKFIKPLVSKKRVVLFTACWIIGAFLIAIAASDLFTNSIFQREYLIFYILAFINGIFVLRLWRAYLAQKAQQ